MNDALRVMLTEKRSIGVFLTFPTFGYVPSTSLRTGCSVTLMGGMGENVPSLDREEAPRGPASPIWRGSSAFDLGPINGGLVVKFGPPGARSWGGCADGNDDRHDALAAGFDLEARAGCSDGGADRPGC